MPEDYEDPTLIIKDLKKEQIDESNVKQKRTSRDTYVNSGWSNIQSARLEIENRHKIIDELLKRKDVIKGFEDFGNLPLGYLFQQYKEVVQYYKHRTTQYNNIFRVVYEYCKKIDDSFDITQSTKEGHKILNEIKEISKELMSLNKEITKLSLEYVNSSNLDTRQILIPVLKETNDVLRKVSESFGKNYKDIEIKEQNIKFELDRPIRGVDKVELEKRFRDSIPDKSVGEPDDETPTMVEEEDLSTDRETPVDDKPGLADAHKARDSSLPPI